MNRSSKHRILTWVNITLIALLILFVQFVLPDLFILPVKQVVISTDKPDGGFSLRPGDILVRPNWNWLPGTNRIEGGRNFGHLAVVVAGAEGSSVSEVLRKSRVIEALLFDQKTRRFIFGSRDIVRETEAATSFGERFSGRRYLLRMQLSPAEQERLIFFLRKQLDDDRYSILSVSRKFSGSPGSPEAYRSADRSRWNCATLAWCAFRFATGKNINSGDDWLVYPNDIIRSPLFDPAGNRVRF